MSKRPSPSFQRPDTVSSLIHHLEKNLPQDEKISFGRFLSLLGVHGFVFFLFILAVLNIVIFMVPGFSIFFGVPMVILAVQMLLGIKVPIFPSFLLAREIQTRLLRKGLDSAVQPLEKIEKYIRPRFLVLTHPWGLKLHFLAALVMALMVAIPIPFVNLPPTFGVLFLTIGLMQRDGIFVALAYVFGLWSLRLYESLGTAAHGLLGP